MSDHGDTRFGRLMTWIFDHKYFVIVVAIVGLVIVAGQITDGLDKTLTFVEKRLSSERLSIKVDLKVLNDGASEYRLSQTGRVEVYGSSNATTSPRHTFGMQILGATDQVLMPGTTSTFLGESERAPRSLSTEGDMWIRVLVTASARDPLSGTELHDTVSSELVPLSGRARIPASVRIADRPTVDVPIRVTSETGTPLTGLVLRDAANGSALPRTDSVMVTAGTSRDLEVVSDCHVAQPLRIDVDRNGKFQELRPLQLKPITRELIIVSKPAAEEILVNGLRAQTDITCSASDGIGVIRHFG